MPEPVSISSDIYTMIQENAQALSHKPIKDQPEHLRNLESLVKSAYLDWSKKNRK